MKLPEREYYTISELAERWKTNERHILELILNRHLDSVVLVAADGTKSWPDSTDPAMLHEDKARHLLEMKTWYDTELLFDLYTKGKGKVRRYNEGFISIELDPAVDIDAEQLLVTSSEIREFEARNERTDEKGDEPIEPRERASYLKLIKLLCHLNDLDISEPYKAYDVLQAMADLKGLEMPVSKNNAAPKLKAAHAAPKLKAVRDID